MPRVRLGIVLLFPPPLDAAVDGLRLAFGDPMREKVAPHITLVAPINVRVADVAEVLAIMRQVVPSEPLDLTVGPITAFPTDEHVAYLAVGGAERARATLDRVVRQLRRGPLDREPEHEFVPHVTLAQGVGAERLTAILAAGVGWTEVAASFERMHLLEERDTEAGKRWVPIADVALARRHIVGVGGDPLELTPSEHVDPEAIAAGVEPMEPIESIEGNQRGSGRPTPGVRPLVVTARRSGAVVGVTQGTVHGHVAQIASTWLADGLARPDRDDVREQLHELWHLESHR